MRTTTDVRGRVAGARGWLGAPVGRGFALALLASAAAGFAMSAQQNVVANYFEDVLGLSGPEFGYITAIREVPGLLLIGLVALFYRLSLPALAAGALGLLAVGYALFGVSSGFWSVAPWVVLSSVGYHTWLQIQPALGMSLVTESRSGSVLGRLAAATNAGTLGAMLVVLVGFELGFLGYGSTFVLCGFFALLAAVAIARFPHLENGEARTEAVRRQPIVLRREYRYYYLLSLLDGGRQQIFFSFGLWVLVHQYGLGVPAISVMLLAGTALGIVGGPWVGRMVDRYGERRMLAWVNVAYVVALAGYALADSVAVAILCYVAYTLVFPLSHIGAATYLRKIAVSDELAPSLAMGLTMQHAAAVVVPIATGFVLNYVGYQIPFLVACGFASLTFLVTRRLAPETQKSARRLAEEAEAARSAPRPIPATAGH